MKKNALAGIHCRLLMPALFLAGALPSFAASGTWNYNGSDNWSNTARWNGGTVADGAGFTANFNMNITGGRTVRLDTDRTIGTIVANDTDNNQSWTINTNAVITTLTLATATGTPTFDVRNQQLNIWNIQLAGTNGFTKIGNGQLRLHNANNSNLTGNATVSAGVVYIKGDGSLGAAPGAYVANAITLNGGGLKNNDSNPTIDANRGLYIGTNGAWFTVGWGNQNLTVNSPITGPGTLHVNFDQPNPSRLVPVNPANDYAGNTVIGVNDGPRGFNNANNSFAILRLGASEVIPHGAGKGDVTVQNGQTGANLHYGVLDLNGFSETINGLNGNGAVSNQAAGAVTLTIGDNGASGTYFGSIVNRETDGAISIVKVGAGHQALAGSNYFSGTVTVEAGSLGFSTLTNLTVREGAGVGAGAIGYPSSSELLSDLNLTNATIDIDLSDSMVGGGGVNDLMIVSNLNLTGANTIRVTPIRALSQGLYTAIYYHGAMSGSAAANLAATVPGTRYSATVDDSSPNQIMLNVTGAASNLVWTGANGTAWDITNAVNWADGASPETFHHGDTVTFGDGSSTQLVTLTQNLYPSDTIVNSASNYTFQGTGRIGGQGGLVKRGNGTLLINNTNEYAGATVVEGGILALGSLPAAGPIGNPITVTNGGTLDLRGLVYQLKPLVISGAGLNGTGAVINTGANQNDSTRMLTLTGDTTVGGTGRWDLRNTAGAASLSTGGNAYNYTKTGPNQHNWIGVNVDPALANIDIRQGMLGIEQLTSDTLGDPNYPLTVHSNATLQFWNYRNILAKPLVFLGGGRWLVDSGNVEAGTNRIGGAVTLNDGIVTFQHANGTTASIYPGITGAGGFQFAGGGILRLNGNNVYTGQTILQGTAGQTSTAVLQSNGTIAASSEIVLRSGRLLLDNQTVNLGDRIADSIPLTGQGGQLTLRCPTNGTASETVGVLTLTNGTTVVTADNADNGAGTASTALTLGGLVRGLAGTVNFTSVGLGTLGGGPVGSPHPHVYITGQAPGVIPFGTVDGTQLAVYDAANGVYAGTPTVEFDGSANQAGQRAGYSAGRTIETDDLTDNRTIDSLTINAPAGAQILLQGYRLDVTSGGILHSGTNSFLIADQAGGGTIAGTDLVFNVTQAAGALRIAAPITAVSSLNKEGAGLLVLTASNTYAGVTRIGAGTLRVGEFGTTGSMGTNAVINLGTLSFARTDTTTVDNVISGTGLIRQDGYGGLLILSGDNRFFYGNVDVWTGAVRVTHSYALGAWGTGTVFLARQGNAAGALRALELSGGITISGKLAQTSGLSFSNAANSGLIRSLDGTNQWLGPIELQGGAGDTGIGVDSGHLTLGDRIYSGYTAGARGLRLYGAGEGLITGPISNGANTVNLFMQGSGTWTLAGTNVYSGPTSIESGKLLVNGLNLGVGAVTVRSNAVLGGTGTVAGATTVLAGGILEPGASPGTMTFGGALSLDGDAVLRFELGTESDRIVAGGNLSLGGRLQITDAGGFGVGSYTLFQYGGTLAGSAPTIEAAPAGYIYEVSTATPGVVVLNVRLPTAYESWQLQYFSSTTDPAAAAGNDADGDRMSNDAEFRAGTNPTNVTSVIRLVQAVRSGNDMVLTWTAAGIRTNQLQSATTLTPENFTDIGSPVFIPTAGDTVTNYLDAGGATNAQPRFYRVRLVEP